MDITSNQETLESIFELPGEPAIVINGVPPLSSGQADPFPSIVANAEPKKLIRFGEWLEGREVKKKFGKKFYIGKVTEYDEEMGWYKVVYQDGDSEDLEWHELEEILLPLDVTIPVRTLASKIVKKSEKSAQKSEKRSGSGRGRGASNAKGKRGS